MAKNDMARRFLKNLERNPCLECHFYNRENNTCQSKKCSTGGSGYIGFWDRMFCEPYRGTDKQEVPK